MTIAPALRTITSADELDGYLRQRLRPIGGAEPQPLTNDEVRAVAELRNRFAAKAKRNGGI
jgi:hypothetical protein